jgi:hypothetical protein
MKRVLYSLAIAGLLPFFFSRAAIAQPHQLQAPVNSGQFNQLSRDLTRPSVDDFFEQGREQLEQEIDILLKRRLLLSEGLLKIDEKLQVPQDFTNFESPNLPVNQDSDRLQ